MNMLSYKVAWLSLQKQMSLIVPPYPVENLKSQVMLIYYSMCFQERLVSVIQLKKVSHIIKESDICKV